MVYLEHERIVSILLEVDLSNPKSLAWRVLFDSELRERVITELNGITGCWKRERLAQRLLKNKVSKKDAESCGTIFFWGIDHKKRRVPLSLEIDVWGNRILRGVSDHGRPWEIPYTPQAIIRGLHENKLLPSNFTSFLAFSFARNVPCIGGYFQCEYLPTMQRGLVTALQDTIAYRDVAQMVARIPTDWYLDSMLAVMTRVGDGGLVPAGPVEIIAGGGITSNDIERMLSLTVREAHLADMFDTALDAVPQKLRPSGWKQQLAADCSRLLEGKIVVK
jgi:hypothetical protein